MARVLVGTSGYLVPALAERAVPRGPRHRPAAPAVRERLRHGRDQQHVLPAHDLDRRRAWREHPAGFLFAAKGSRYITHMKKLKEPEAGLRRFFAPLAPLGEKLGPVSCSSRRAGDADLGRLDTFLAALPPAGATPSSSASRAG